MKWTKFFMLLSLQVVIMVAVGMVGTFVVEYLTKTNWFGDRFYLDGKGIGFAGEWTDVVWGARHYWFVWGVFMLFVIQIFRIGKFAWDLYGEYEKDDSGTSG
jgi:hypothetical protein